MTHKERHARRQAIIAEWRQGARVTELAEKYGLHRETVFQLTRGASDFDGGVRRRDMRHVPSKGYAILADLMYTTLNLTEIAVKHSTSHQRVGQVVTAASAAGISFPSRRRGRPNVAKS